MRADRLLKLSEYLRGVDRRRFDLQLWADGERGTDITPNCYTTACAVGHACLSRMFEKEGLGYQADRSSWSDEPFIRPTFGDHQGYSAVEDFFDITAEDAHHLFSIFSYPPGRRGPKSVAKRIEKFVQKGAVSV